MESRHLIFPQKVPAELNYCMKLSVAHSHLLQLGTQHQHNIKHYTELMNASETTSPNLKLANSVYVHLRYPTVLISFLSKKNGR